MRLRGFRWFVFGALALAGPLALHAREADPVSLSLTEAGGASRWDRVETVDWSFSCARPSPTGVVVWQGRQRLKRGPAGFALREDLETPEGRYTVWGGSVPWVEGPGAAPSQILRAERVADARRRAFLVLAPFSFFNSAAPPRYEGSGYFRSRLVRRLRWETTAPSPVVFQAAFFPFSVSFAGPVTVFLDADTGRFRGLSCGSLESDLFEDHETRQNLLTGATQWTRFNAQGQRVEVLRADALVFNSYVDDEVFQFSIPGEPAP